MSKDKSRKFTIHLGDGSPIVTKKTLPNDKCLCGSGKKQKQCCGLKTEFYSTKPKRESPDQSNYIDKAMKEKYGVDFVNSTTQADALKNP